MKKAMIFAAASTFCSLAGCATSSTPYSPVRDASYSALGEDPFWMVAIGDDKIVLTLPADPGTRRSLNSHIYPRVLPRTTGGVKRWESGEGAAVITIEARPGPCATGGKEFEDRVRVTLSGRAFEGCGGRQIRGKRT
ncbi:hypothetical protein [Sphingosinicella rhizophila]|uniref:Lipoprotein n=1 Tax=Sphingosinicella rhizophila TaxID=3050082 RepID=A0ABU3Q1W6_9SPHN|nr:hypothetical protein [Sphingosinicella sp. GR2756]MDT9597420.1 hypothetical protein [Sphingosinicella sp. GR2756]